MRTTPATADLVAPGAAGWCEEFLSTSKADRWLRASCRSAAGQGGVEACGAGDAPRHRPALDAAQTVDRIAGPGCDRGRGVQVVVLGAGFDTLGVRLAVERPDLRVVEIDHPATLAVKRSVVERKLGCGGPVMAEADFSRDDGTESLLPPGVIDRTRRTVFLAEGLLMYLPEARSEITAC